MSAITSALKKLRASKWGVQFQRWFRTRAEECDALATLKRDRISQRLIGTFDFSDVGRSFERDPLCVDEQPGVGGFYVLSPQRAREGVFQTDG